jgi:Zn finger protein HypA/HybF involved in hydrogenase expression
VDELVETCREHARGRSVHQVRVRCPTTVDAEELSLAFAAASRRLYASTGDANLATAELKLELVPVRLSCACGFEGKLTNEDLAGHMSICPQCARVGEADARLELLSITFAEVIEPFGAA